MSDELRMPERREMPRRRKQQRRAHLVRELQGRRRRSPRPLILIPAVLAVVASGAFAATRIFDDDEPAIEDYLVVDCYESASLDSPSRDAVADIIAAPGERPGDRTPAEMCAGLWETGELGSGEIVPRLASCVRHREVRVVPGGPQTCGVLGLRELPGGYQSGAARLTEFTERVAQATIECTTEEEFEANVRAVYEEFGRELAERITFEPLPGRDCVGGYPRPAALWFALFGGAGAEATDQARAVDTPAERRSYRRAERRRLRRTKDEHDYYLRMLTRLSRQLCEYDEYVPDRATCLAEVRRDARQARRQPRVPVSPPAGDVVISRKERAEIKPRDLRPEMRQAIREAERQTHPKPSQP